MSNHQIARDETSNGYLISTVRLPGGPYETTVFGTVNGRRDWNGVSCRRATTKAEALKYHNEAVAMYGARS